MTALADPIGPIGGAVFNALETMCAAQLPCDETKMPALGA
jgi:hypothetical protein